MTAGNFQFHQWASAPPSWITTRGTDINGVILSSRVRVARNFAGIPFPHHAPVHLQAGAREQAVSGFRSSALAKSSHVFDMDRLSPLEKTFLMERHLISHQHAQGAGAKGLIVSAGEHVSIMINEEDHVRAAVFEPGLALTDAWTTLSRLDDTYAKEVSWAVDAETGFLTACPTNLGTGLRASCLLHLPALSLSGRIASAVKELEDAGIVTRGFHGEGTNAVGDLYQISNARTLGRAEEAIVKDVEKFVQRLAELETKEGAALLAGPNRLALEDRVWRSAGTLRSARLLSFDESMKCLSLVRLGARLGMEAVKNPGIIAELFFLIQPAHLVLQNAPAEGVSDEALRAEFVRQKLK